MKTIIRNFTSIFRKFATANLLNLLGLSLAFASFFVIMTQVNFDLGYNKSITEHENLFRMTLKLGPSAEDYGTMLPRPVVEQLAAASPHVTGYSIRNGWINYDQFVVDNQEYSLNLIYGEREFLSVFKPTVISGDVKGLDQIGNIVLPRSEALRMFGTTDAAGKTMKYKWDDKTFYNVCAVIEDYPENNLLHGACFIGVNWNEGNYDNWNYDAYIRVDDVANLSTVQNSLRQTVIELFKDKFELKTKEEEEAVQVIFTNVADAHFSKFLDKSAPARSSIYLLICFSEAVLISLIAFVLALLIVYLAHDLGLQELVQGSILLQDHQLLIALTLLLSIIVGLMAGAYPSYYVTSFPPALVLKGSFGLSPKGRMLRSVLICLQFIVSFMLVIGVGVMYLQSYLIYHTDYGFDKDEVLVVRTAPDTRNKVDAIDADLRSISGIEGASLTQSVLGSSDSYMTWGRGEGEKHTNFTCIFVDWRFLDVMGIDISPLTIEIIPSLVSARISSMPPCEWMIPSSLLLSLSPVRIANTGGMAIGAITCWCGWLKVWTSGKPNRK